MAGSGGTAGDPGTPAVRFIGRTDTRQAAAVRFAWSGSGLTFRFNGADAEVRLDDAGQFFTVLVDGAQQADLVTQPGARNYPVASQLAAGDHEVTLLRRTEASIGTTRYLDIELNGGTLLPPPPPKAHKLEVIGDSITCGYGNEGADMNCNFSPDTENHYLTYEAIAARELDADLVTVAWSGKGVIYNFGDDKVDPLPALYDRALPQDDSSSWDFKWQADAVVINLGTNDFSTDGDPTEAEFSDAYRAFVEHLRAKYPNAMILCMAPAPLLDGADLTTAQQYIQGVVNQLNAAGDNKIRYFSMTVTNNGYGCDWHPSLATHQAMATALTAQLKSVMGW